MLGGDAATDLAVRNGLHEANLLTESAAQKYENWKTERRGPGSHDTLGMLAIDSAGHMAGGCSTSGLAFKLPGRVGDSPIIGAGLYLEPGVGAATATGAGEEMIRVCGAHAIVENMRRGMPPEQALRDILERIHRRRGHDAGDVSFLALRQDGAYAAMSLWSKTKFRFAVRTSMLDELIASSFLT